jgi:hypothetical protein
MACQLCMMASCLRDDDVIIIRVGHLVFGSGQPIRAKKTRAERLRAWADDSPERDGACGHVRGPILMPFSPVASSLPPLHSGMVKTQF